MEHWGGSLGGSLVTFEAGKPWGITEGITWAITGNFEAGKLWGTIGGITLGITGILEAVEHDMPPSLVVHV